MLDQRTLSAGPADAGWYADPLDPARLRWWDGESWTARLAATKPSGPTRRGIPDLPVVEDTVPAVPPTRVAFQSGSAEAPTKTRELPVVDAAPVLSPARGDGVSLATDPIASLENLFNQAEDEEIERPQPSNTPLDGLSVPTVAAPISVIPAAIAGAAAVAPAVHGPTVPVPAAAAPQPSDAPAFLTDSTGDLTLLKRHRAEPEETPIDPAGFVPGGRRARRHAEALAAATAPVADEVAQPEQDDEKPEAPAVSPAELLAAAASAAVPEAPSPAAAAAAAPLIAAAVAPELIEPVLTAALAAPSDTAEIIARINREARAEDETVHTASLPLSDEDDDADDVEDVPSDVAPVGAAALTLLAAPSVLPTQPSAERIPSFTLPAALATPAAAPAEAPHFAWKAEAPASVAAPAVTPAAPADSSDEDEDLNEFAGVFGALTPSNRVAIEPEPEKWSTGSAWTLALSPVLTAVIGLGIAMLAVTGSINEAQTRWYVIGANLVLFAVFLLSAMADRRALRAAGYTRTASEFWLLLTPLAYLIARTVLVRRKLARGSAPLWVHVATAVAVGAAALGASLIPQAAPVSPESQYETALEQALAAEGTDATVTCPADITATVGSTYTCTAVDAAGTPLTVGIEMQDEGRFAYTVSDAAATTAG